MAHLYINHNQLSIVRAGDLEGLTALERILFDSQDRTDSSGKPLLTTIAIACFPQIPGDVGRPRELFLISSSQVAIPPPD